MTGQRSTVSDGPRKQESVGVAKVFCRHSPNSITPYCHSHEQGWAYLRASGSAMTRAVRMYGTRCSATTEEGRESRRGVRDLGR